MTRLKNWLPVLVMMAVIFAASSIPGDDMPHFDEFDFSVKKLGHSVGYALLAASYLRGLKSINHKGHKGHKGDSLSPFVTFVFKYSVIFAWLMAVLYAITDELHQSFTPGRNPSIWDVSIYDNFGAMIGVWIYSSVNKRKDDALAPPRANSQ